MEAQYGTDEYEKEKGMGKYHINFWYRQADCLLTLRALSLTNQGSFHFCSITPNCHPNIQSSFCIFAAPHQHQINQTLEQDRLKGGHKRKYFHHILGATKFEVHLQNFSEVSTRAGCGVTIYLGITREASHIFYNWIRLIQGLFNSLITLLHREGGILIPI